VTTLLVLVLYVLVAYSVGVRAGERRRASTVQVARLVADHWRRAAISWSDRQMPGHVTAHPLCCVLAALDGETDPDRLGVGDGPERDAIRALRSGTTPAE
jgi:hypothetical protein